MCADERQWVPPGGQRWTTLAELAAAGHRSDVRAVEPGLTGIGADPPVAIGQRSLLVATPEGNLLWDPSGFIDDAAVAAVRAAGGLRFVTASHPHFYGAIAEWARAFGAEILVPADDVAWLRAGPELRGAAVVGDAGRAAGGDAGPVRRALSRQRGAALGAGGAGAAGCCWPGTRSFVTPGEDRVTFVWSAPNRLPLSEEAVLGVAGGGAAVLAFDRIYGGWWTPVLRSGAWETVRRSGSAVHRAPDAAPLSPSRGNQVSA